LAIIATVQDIINRTAWRTRGALRWYQALNDWTDPGEAAAVAYLSDEVRGQPLLDIGVGAGRTVPLLLRVSANYIGVDYTPELVALCRRNHPGTQVCLMDARDMSAFEDGRFALAMFSFNGIDSVDYDDRRKILNEVARVLKPGGLALFSTHNLRGPGYRERLTRALQVPRTGGLLEFGISCARVAFNFPAAAINYFRYSPLNREYDGYGVRVCAAHRFGILLTYTELSTQRQQCADAGLITEAIFGSDSGRLVSEGSDLTAENWLHFIVRKAVPHHRARDGNQAIFAT
jgi:SAM-dependent methyltransferase